MNAIACLLVAQSGGKRSPIIEWATGLHGWELIWAVGLLLAGAIGSHLWLKYRTRLRPLTWRATHIPLAFSGEHQQAGRVEVLHNGVPVRSLHITQVELANDTSKDLENLTVTTAYLEGTRLLYGRAEVAGGLQDLPFSAGFDARLDRYLANPQQAPAGELEALQSHREFLVRALNRGARVRFALLATRDDENTPRVNLACVHPGVVLRETPGSAVLVFGVQRNAAVWVGLLGSLVIAAAVTYLYGNAWAAAIAGLVTGWFAQIIGAGLVKFGRVLGRALG